MYESLGLNELTFCGPDEMAAILLNENFRILYTISPKYVPLGSSWHYGNIGSDNGLAPNSLQTIIWSNVGMF